MSKLVCLHGINKGDQFELEGQKTLSIGRSPDCSIVLYDRKVSRHHCTLTPRGKFYIVEDLNSTHGTQLNGHPLKGKETFREGDKLRVGQTTLVLSSKEVGGLLEQTATDAARDLEEHSFGYLMGEAAEKVVSAHDHGHKPPGFFKRLFSVFSSKS
jgi:pSer/pThr/pTyr-binding forkhead associated (FHA) protein